MEMETGEESLHSFATVRHSEVYPKKALVLDDPSLEIPFPCLPGEGVEFLGRTTHGLVALSSYRLFLTGPDLLLNLPLGLLETVECRDIFHLHLHCKDVRSFRCSFATNEDCQKWYRRICNAIQPPKKLDDLFAFRFFLYCHEEHSDSFHSHLKDDKSHLSNMESSVLYRECKRMGFDTDPGGVWKISDINKSFDFCQSYPQYILVPASVQDQDMEDVASFRYSRRIPAVVWRHHMYGTVIARSAQPEVGWLGWRSPKDENLIQAIADACSIEPGLALGSFDSSSDGRGTDLDGEDTSLLSKGISTSLVDHVEVRPARCKMLILDARSYAAAVANRAKGGGCECPEYYPNCEVQFMGLANIHSIRKSFQTLRAVCSSSAADQSCWMSSLESTKWQFYISSLMKAALVVANAVDLERRPVLVHCSDGWDRTPQLVALAELMLDPYYRTIEGFEVLVEKEWLEFGHKFSSRCGNGVGADDPNERCPVFLQWLDCVHQLVAKFPCSFEFNQQYLVKLAQHTYTSLFGTFLGNSSMERDREQIAKKTFSVWKFLRSHPEHYRNYLYSHSGRVLRPQCQVRDLKFWGEVYLQPTPPTGVVTCGQSKALPPEPRPESTTPSASASPSSSTQTNLVKTKSADSLFSLSLEHLAPEKPQRRLSDSSLHSLPIELNLDSGMLSPAVRLNSGDIPSGECREVNGSEASTESDSGGSLPVENGVPGLENGVNEQFCVHPINESTDTLINEAVAAPSEGVATQHILQCGPREKLEVECDKNCVPAAHILRSAASTSTTDISSSTVCNRMDAASDGEGKCILCLTHKSTPESILGAARAALVRPSMNSRGSHSSTPLHSRTPSSGFPATPCDDHSLLETVGTQGLVPPAQQFSIDGFNMPIDEQQERLHQLILAHKAEVESLQHELYKVKLALCSRSCPHSNGREKIDAPDDVMSLDSACSGEPSLSGGQDGSVSSDHSWEHVDERDTRSTLWVPDHATSHCTGCDKEFWIGRRRHHCRNCGRIFCGQCASQEHPLPHEHLYQPVRVCVSCFEMLRSRGCRPLATMGAGHQHSMPKSAVTAASN
ncbi:myotubularin-related protein 4-like isoform X5 [Ornithodoros turicata]|uniref:myotubularin-related protein 4-like isoform X5 n=2 Tax=Ornithodoros turicata TaxID=34597 RepID=UPI003138CE64